MITETKMMLFLDTTGFSIAPLKIKSCSVSKVLLQIKIDWDDSKSCSRLVFNLRVAHQDNAYSEINQSSKLLYSTYRLYPVLKGEHNTKAALRYLNYSPTIKEIDAILVNLKDLNNGSIINNICGPVNLEMDDYVSIALSFIFKIYSSVESEDANYRDGRRYNGQNLKPYGEKGSRKYQEILVEVINDFISCKKLKEK
jgi:hypothetical protein